ncbi:Ras guanine nucleotide exchange factor domain-containing protein [Rozella allomycis CSF55]|uniref:Ras guanine nucleotide exchange factor domain-containing protein n=1 Tax=Rozella allomycis (strain CSF55) TaxID=988480 RepID=A0A075AWE3_ROZAC|nr:Ras guanine nucleotide exchange factor domain-containing protein [Rozella allomycis CSF55]|eukprot:EPZ34570.1 Ras guanine nucleotide exchange factor domain-containing protein [Rozella allomycis CSF55]
MMYGWAKSINWVTRRSFLDNCAMISVFAYYKATNIAETLHFCDLEIFSTAFVKKDFLTLRKERFKFNNVTRWCVDQVENADTLSEKINIIEKLIKVLIKLVSMNNFQTSMSILLCLQSLKIERHEWNRISRSELLNYHELVYLFSPLKNFKKLRKRIEESETNCIPFMGNTD